MGVFLYFWMQSKRALALFFLSLGCMPDSLARDSAEAFYEDLGLSDSLLGAIRGGALNVLWYL